MSTAKEKFELARQRYAATFERHLDNGVEFISDNVYIEPEVIITPGTVILPGCILRGKTVIAENCVIGPNTLLEDTVVEAGTTINASQCYESHIGPNNKIGPFTHVRTGTKTAEGCHLGADGEGKYHTTIGDYAFIGCNTNLVAPVTVGDHAFTAAGSTIGHDVPAGALSIERAKQTEIDNWGENKLQKYIAKKQKLEADKKNK